MRPTGLLDRGSAGAPGWRRTLIATDYPGAGRAPVRHDLDLAGLFRTRRFRTYTTDDVVGVEMAGALKNVYAIAVGMGYSLGIGENTRAMVMARAVSEMSKLGVAMGGHRDTFGGLAGMGDLIVTCTSQRSRNRHVGEQLGSGKTVEEIVKAAYGKNQPLFNNAGQHYNHSHFWKWMKPNGGGSKLPGRLEKKINEDLGGFEKFKTDFAAAGVGQFGSGPEPLHESEKD